MEISQTVFDLNKLRQMQKLMGDGFDQLKSLFIQSCSSKVIALQSANAEQDLEQVKALAHAIRGSAGNIGAIQLQQLAMTIEEQITQSQHEALTETIARTSQCVTATINALEQFSAEST